MRGVLGGKVKQTTLFISIRTCEKKGYKSKADRHTSALAGSVHATHFESSTKHISENLEYLGPSMHTIIEWYGLEEGRAVVLMSRNRFTAYGIGRSVAEQNCTVVNLNWAERIVVCPCYLSIHLPSTPIARGLLPSTVTI
jgi:hypothetical protein